MSARPMLEHARAVEWMPWDQYTPTWTAVTANPAIVNGTISGAFRRIGTTGFCRGVIKMGASTTYGTGGWRVSLPSGWTASGAVTDGWQSGTGVYFGASTYRGDCYVSPGITYLSFVHTSPWAAVTGTVPFSWASTHFLTWNITLELAT